jgi:predicted O-methyltransferase YrrM
LLEVASDFISYAEQVRRRSVEAGLHPIEVDDALVIYALAFTYAATHDNVLALDLGAGCGYSSIWLAKALEEGCTGVCRLVAVERQPGRAEEARRNLEGLHLRRITYQVVVGDAIEFLEGLRPGSVDLAFVDVRKEEYPTVLSLLESRLTRGGIAIFHNAIIPTPPANFYDLVRRPTWRSTIVPTGFGILVAVKQTSS